MIKKKKKIKLVQGIFLWIYRVLGRVIPALFQIFIKPDLSTFRQNECHVSKSTFYDVSEYVPNF